MNKIVRTATKISGGITAEEEKLLAIHTAKWIKNALRTTPIDSEKIIPAIEKLYEAANLKKPRVVVVSSPLVMAFAYGAAASIIKKRKSSATANMIRRATDDATDRATVNPTDDATDNMIRRATDDAIRRATDNPTRRATDDATANVTDNATRRATANATANVTDSATDDATDSATVNTIRIATVNTIRRATDDAAVNTIRRATANETHIVSRNHRASVSEAPGAAQACFELAGEEGLEYAKKWYNVYQGGNMWSSYACYLSAMRDVLGLRLPEHDKYSHWEECAKEGGFRVMHEDFCLVSDFPEFIHMDDDNRPHCETGPSHRWRDGWALYHWHGVAVPEHWIMNRKNLDPNEIIKVDNVELKAAGAEIAGWPKMLEVLKAKIIDDSGSDDIGQLVELTLPGLSEPGLFLKALCPRNGIIMEGVPRISEIDNLPITTALHAQAWRIGDPLSEYIHPQQRT